MNLLIDNISILHKLILPFLIDIDLYPFHPPNFFHLLFPLIKYLKRLYIS